MEEDTEYLKLPIDERCQHKLWKARVNGYEAAAKQFQSLDEKNPEFSKYLGLIKKFVTDSNAAAQDKGLDAVLAYVENAGCAGKTVGEVMSGIVTKCLGAPKAKTKEKGMAIAMMYIEIEKQEIVQEELTKGLSNKTPKIVSACVAALREALREFGSKVISIKLLVKHIPPLLEDRDKTVREEAKLLTVEVYRWTGAAIKPQLSSLKPVQLTELEAEFVKLGGEKPAPTRFLRSQQELRAKMQQQVNGDEDAGAESEDDSSEAPVDEDPYVLMEAVNILSQLSGDFYEKCEAKKWQERKEAMDALQTLTSNPKLESGDYGDLVRTLKKIISKDANVVVVAVAVKCLGSLAIGLRMKFHPYASQCVPTILEKFKEKKQAVVQALREAIDAIYPTTSLEAVQEDILAALDNKNPAVKSETAAFLARCFRTCTPVILNKKLLKIFSTALVKTLNDTDPSVRDNSAEALGTAMKVVSEKNITPFIQDIGPVKLAKVMECYEKAEIVVPKPSGGKPARTKSAPPKGKVSTNAEYEEEAVIMPRKLPSSQKPLSAPPGGNKPANTRPKGASAKTKKSSTSSGAKTTEVLERELTPEEVDEQAEALLPPEVFTGLGDANWKTRLSAIEQFMEFIKGLDKKEVPTQTMVRILAKKPGFKDTNFQVLRLRLEAVLYLASECVFSRRSAQYCILDLADKLGDPKNGALAAETLIAISEATKLDYVSLQVLDTVFSQKNPKTHAESLNWLASAIKEFGVKQVQVKAVIEYIKKALASTNPAVRSSAVNLLGVMYLYIGPSLRVFFENEKSALLQQIDAEFEKLQGIPPPVPTRGIPVESKLTDDAVEEEGGAGDGGPPTINIADLIPRTDICALLTPQLLQELADKNWKVRGEALQRLATIVSEAKFITPNLGDLPPVLKARTTDSNRNLAIQALNICQAIGTAMGPNCTKYVRMLAHGMVLALGDTKSMVRAAGLSCLNAWLEQCGLNPFVEGEMLSDALKMENPCLRAELLGWLLITLPTVKVISPDLSLCVPYLYSCLEDRNSDVRKKAQDAVLPFMIHLGYDKMVQATGKLKPVSKTAVSAALDKAKASLPAKPAPKNQKRNGGAPASNRQEDADASKGKISNGPKRATSKTRLTQATANKGKRKEEDTDMSPSLQFNNLKEQRVLDEQRLKVLKWNFTSPRDEFYEQLKDQMTTAGVNRGLQANMFHNDFKFHIKAIDALIECLESNPEATVANLDLVLKWLALRFFDTNPSVLLKGLEYLQQLFLRLSEDHYSLLDYEATSFIPYLVLKVGDPKDTVRQAVRSLFRLICKVYPASKMFSYIIEGLKSKNARQRTECLEELGNLIESYGINVCQPNPQAALKEVTHQISDRDNSVRNAALNCVVQAYFLEGEKVYRYVGHISDKEMSLLEERIKRSSRNRPPPSAVNRVSTADATRTSRPGAKVIVPPPSNEKKDDEQVLTIRRPSSQPPSRPVSGMFSLDLDKIEKMMEESMALEMPNLVEHDLDELKPVCLPATRIRRPISPASKLLSHSSDVSSAMDLVISQIASNDINTAVHALAQIDEFLKDEDRAEMMQSRVDQLVIAVTLQLRMVYSRHMGDDSTNGQDIIKLYRCLTMTLVTLFHNRNLAKRASKSVLRDLVDNLVTILLDERLNRLEEGPHVIRSINVLIVKVVERASLTNILCALIKLLHDRVGNDTSASKFTELVMKCLWKTLRMLPALMAELNIDLVLLELHLFLKAYPSPHWKERSTDTPLRTVKTLLHTLVKHNGNKIMSHLTLIDNLQESEMEAYLQKLLKGGLRHRPSDNQQLDEKTGRKDIKSPRRISKSAHETLAEIFKKIGSKDYTKEGLADLYDFKQLHPDADIDPFLHKSSQFFQNYIERGLRTISQERQGHSSNNAVRTTLSETTYRSGSPNFSNNNNNTMITTNISTVTAQVSSSVIGSQVDLQSASIYKERLKMLRARCGYDNADIRIDPSPVLYDIKPSMLNRGSATPPEPLSSDSKTSAEMIVPMGIPRSESSDAVSKISKPNMNVDDLRQRLEKIKNSTRT